ncbi:msp domain protein [Ichthyophthirius multifiliis]|uniref:Msp domain protein n=1 Tax=Ichthyophthirius multifiliis TaxID=5932 RepID=G0R0A0_ICHMU|nr:msp domain protein [Ichthyophthirius multifiliis]EGR29108.1 msp domain protein [Ichthyophthirius multifiliis]|eukprot:XP_004030344.1 msp domain protein [Ichthyophthirius multifiliis]
MFIFKNIFRQMKQFEDYVDLYPLDRITFSYLPSQLMHAQLRIKNKSNSKLLYKIKTTNPRNYAVKPSQGTIHSFFDTTIDLTMQPFQHIDVNNLRLTDKFLIIIAEVNDEQAQQDDLNEIFEKKGLKKKLEVSIIQNNESTNQQMYNSQEQIKKSGNLLNNSQNKLYQSVNNAFSTLNTINDDKQKEQVEKYENELKLKIILKQVEQVTKSSNYSIIHIIIIALLSLIIGTLIQK